MTNHIGELNEMVAQWEAQAGARHKYARRLRDKKDDQSQLQSRFEQGWATGLEQCAEELRRRL